ncbi:chitobiase/beta-hexosaminidase C-terminal domain-containing protein [Acidicapsa ligni]|uniref:chitobiase/beta-hexosaminidase C-terminal domain-containing protein n=1 Tax=Acidicapsa ligni TaxID=542300 RepID=UPI0021DFE8F7|nr:chitobiase/beta-hexosaminidase C-terminal domain-containing protein [Acidicapsa ligni]
MTTSASSLVSSFVFSLALAVFTLMAPPATLAIGPAAHPANDPAKNKIQVAKNYGNLPLSFEANQGQTDKNVKFLSRGIGYSLFLTDSAAILKLTQQNVSAPRSLHSTSTRKADSLRMELLGASNSSHASGISQLPGKVNYFIGNDPTQWQTDLPTYSKVRYTSVYPGIDLIYYGNQRQLEYDFIVAPNANPHSIRFQISGAKKLSVSADGNLQVTAANGQLSFRKPAIYQQINGHRQQVQGQFSLLAENIIGFTLGQYDHASPLIIDPVLTYSTYLGGTDGTSAGTGITVDTAGNAYITGWTQASNFPVTNGVFQPHNKGMAPPPQGTSADDLTNAFITKLDPTGTTLIYSTYVGGTGSVLPNQSLLGLGDFSYGIAVDNSGNAYIAGQTYSTDFPVTANAYQSANNGASNEESNAFITKLNSTGTALLYSTYLGGDGGGSFPGDSATAIAVDPAGDAYVTGYTLSGNFPITPGVFQAANKGTESIFVTKINPAGTALLYSTYLGGSGTISAGDSASAIAIDNSGNAFVTGSVASFDFPVTTNALQAANKVTQGNTTAFVSAINTTGTALLYSTYLGGSGFPFAGYGDSASGIAVDNSGNTYIVGQTYSTDFPITSGSYQAQNNAAGQMTSNAFVVKLNTTGTALLYSTYLGGSGTAGVGDSGTAIAVDTSGEAYVTGAANSGNFPVTPGAFQAVNNAATSNPSTNAFISKLDATGATLLYSTYLGGSYGDSASAIAVDATGNAYLTGTASSHTFPVTPGAFQTTGSSSAFVSKLALGPATTTTTLTSSANPQQSGKPVTFSAKVASAGAAIPTGTLSFSIDGEPTEPVSLDDTGAATYSTSSLTGGPHTILANYIGNSTFLASASAPLTETIQLPAVSIPIFSLVSGAYSTPQSLTITNATSGATIYYTTNGAAPSNASNLYTGPIAITATVTVKAIAVAADHTNSPVASATYTIGNSTQTFTPTFTLAPGTYTTSKTVSIYDATTNAAIYYTLDKTTPTTSSIRYSKAITVATTQTIKAIAVSTGRTNSAVATATYIIETPTATPTFTVPSGTYSTSKTVSIYDATANATIYYTLDQSTPTTSSTRYSKAITVSATQTIKAIAVSTGRTNSAVAAATYTIEAPTATPTFTIPSGTYSTSKTVSIYDATANATIYYTLDQSTPTTSSTRYSKAITVSATQTIKAIAVSTGHPNSAVATATYTIH